MSSPAFTALMRAPMMTSGGTRRSRIAIAAKTDTPAEVALAAIHSRIGIR